MLSSVGGRRAAGSGAARPCQTPAPAGTLGAPRGLVRRAGDRDCQRPRVPLLPCGQDEPVSHPGEEESRSWPQPAAAAGAGAGRGGRSRPSLPTKGHSQAAGQRQGAPRLSPHPRREPRSPEWNTPPDPTVRKGGRRPRGAAAPTRRRRG